MKKILLGIMVIGTVGFLAVQYADAGRGWNGGYGCPYWDRGYSQVQDPASQKNVTTFLKATEQLRKQLAMKLAEYDAIMNAATPNPSKAAAVSGEIFQIRNQIRTKAIEAGLNRGPGRGVYGPRPGWGNGPGYGYGRGGYMY